MIGLRKTLWVSLLLATAAIVPRVAFAQTGSAITGVVKDTTGAVTPGVTVEASSPSLIEKVRTAVTDGQGQYKIIELPAGTYESGAKLSSEKLSVSRVLRRR